MSGALILICISVVAAILAVIGAYSVGRKVSSRNLSKIYDHKIDRLETQTIIADEARGRAENANFAKSAFLANMSHELRTPLNGIVGLTDILSNEKLLPAQLRKVDLINGSSETLLKLLNDILDISKIESGSIDIEKIDIRLHKLMRETYEFWHPIAEKNNINLLFQKQKDMPERLVCDSTRVRQCLDNLLNNALKFTPEGGQVSVKAISEEIDDQHQVSFAVQDTGMGIKPEGIAKLFKPFSQAEEETSRKFGGTGLGLAITKNLCEMMGGNVLVRSKVGVGTRFTMSFMADPSTELSRQANEVSNQQIVVPDTIEMAGLRCLIVEDNPVNMEVLKLLLEPYDLSLVETTNGQAAIQALDTQFFDIVLMDLQMPILGGKEAVSHIRQSGKHYAQIPIIAMTANAMEQDRADCLDIGFNAFLTKPLKRSELISTIDAVAELQDNRNKIVA